MSISILLADDHEMFREGLRMILGTQSDFQVVGQAVNGLEAVTLAERLRPDVAIVDMVMPGLNGLDVIRQIKQSLPTCHLVMLSMHDDEGYVLAALQNGASGYVLKESSTADLIQAVRCALSGLHFLSPSLNERTIQKFIQGGRGKIEDNYETLTTREQQVFHLFAEGLSASEIARKLTISVRTVDTHRANLMRKLGLHSQAELIVFAQKKGDH